MPSLHIVPIQPVMVEDLRHLQIDLFRQLGGEVLVDQSVSIDPAVAYEASRNQYSSSLLLASLLREFSGQSGRILGVTSQDLYVPVLTYVFGEAQLSGPAAIISTHRLDETFYGLPQNVSLRGERIIKEAVHELGHTFGLLHCRRFECVMHSSTTVEDIDLKTVQFCPDCEPALTSAGLAPQHPSHIHPLG